MSATVNANWLRTVDSADLPPRIQLEADDFATPLVAKRIHAPKQLGQAPTECREPKGCAAFALARHRKVLSRAFRRKPKTLESGIEIPMDRIYELCRRFDVAELAFFGSAGRGDMHSRNTLASDYRCSTPHLTRVFRP
jgi:hypothetical protein